MNKHLAWNLPDKYEKNLLTNSMPFENKVIIFHILNYQKLTIQFSIEADFDVIGIQNLQLFFSLKQNDEEIFKTPPIKRKFRNSKSQFNQSLNIELNKVFNQTQDKFTIEIDVQELESSGLSTPNIQKFSTNESPKVQTDPFTIPKKIDVNKIATPEHIFSPIRLKDNELILNDHDRLDTSISEIIPFNNENDSNLEENDIKTPIIPTEKMDVNSLIFDSPKKDQKEDDTSSDSDDDKPNSNIVKDEQPSTKPLPSLSPQIENMKKKKKKKKLFLSDYKLPKIPNLLGEDHAEDSKSDDEDTKNLKKEEDKMTSSQKICDVPSALNLPLAVFTKSSEKPTESQRTIIRRPDSDDRSSSQSETESEDSQEEQIIPEDEDEDLKETYCGLFNQGATCYMNSMLQAFYHLPAFRRLIYKMDTNIGDETEDREKSIKNNIPLQLQKLFATMQTTSETACSTRDLTRSFGWTDEDTIMQHDVQEFCRVILDNLETKIDKQPQLKGSIQNLFRGKIRSYIRCTNVKYESKRDEYFYDLSLDVKGCRNLKESFIKYIEKEKLNGKNQYDTGDPLLGKQDAVMGNEFIQFPPVLHLHLRRFEFNGMGMSKINSRFEFPFEIDLGQFMAEDGEDRDDQVFDLFGVLVHSGTVDGGHYYAFLRPTEKRKWFEFNDSSVSVSSYKKAVIDNFGGSSNDNNNYSQKRMFDCDRFSHHKMRMMPDRFNRRDQFQQRQQMMPQRWFSAYMLVYIRKSEIPFLYQKVSNSEIPDEIRELIIQQEELRRKKEEQKRIQENTIVFHVYNFSDLGVQIRNSNKFSLPNINDYSFGKKFTALRGETFSDLYDKILINMAENSDEAMPKVSFEFWQLNSISMGLKPIDLNRKIDYPSTQGLFLYFSDPVPEENNENENENEKEQKEDENSHKQTVLQNNQMFNYPYIIVFVFIYSQFSIHPITPIRAIKVIKTDPVRILFELLIEKLQIECKSIFKSTQIQSVQEITDIDSSFEKNQIRNGSFLIFETFNMINNEPREQLFEQEETSNKKTVLVRKYIDVYQPDSVIEYLDIIRNMSSFRIISTETSILENSLTEYQVFFPKNRSFKAFLQFLRFIFKIPEIKTVVLYESKSKTPLKFNKDQSISAENTFRIDSLKLFQFDSISENVFQHSLLISFKIVGSLVPITDSTFNCWLNEESTVGDLANYVESSYIIQLKYDFQNRLNCIENCEEEEIKEKEKGRLKELIRQRVVLNYVPSDGQNLGVFAIKKDSLVSFPHDTKLADISEPIITIDIPPEDQFLFENVILKEIEKNKKQSPENEEKADDKNEEGLQSSLMHVLVTENAMNRICNFKEQGNTVITVFEGETIVSIKKRLAFMLNKEEDFFFREEQTKIFSFSLLLSNNPYFKVAPKDDDSLLELMKKGYNKLKLAIFLAAINKVSSSNSSRTIKDESVVIKN